MTRHGGGNQDDRQRNEDFVRDVLSRTSGSGCDRACAQLSDLMDGTLEGMDRELVQAHLEHCDPCRSVAVTFGWLEPLLPQMAEIDPGPAFTARVVKETSRRESYRKPVYAGPTGAAGLMDRVGRWWEQQVMRPMFAAQVAYVATVLLVLLMTVPGSPFKQVPGKALEAVQAGPTSAPVIGPLIDSAADWAGFRADNPLTVARDGLDTKIDKVTGSLGERGRRTAAGRQDFAAHVKVMFSRIGDRQMDEAGYEFLQALDAGRLIWKEWWKDNDANGQ
jgi:hypothetical protein